MTAGWLPTNTLTSHYNCTTKACINCNEDETNSHVFTCSKQEEWRQKFLLDLQQILQEQQTHPEIQQQLLEQVGKTTNKGLANTQRKHGIEWRTVFCGMIPLSIIDKQEQYLQEQNSKKTGNNWANQIRSFLWTQQLTRWKTRCQQNQENKEDDTVTPRRQEVIQRIKNLYEHSKNLNDDDRKFFDVPIVRRLRDKTENLVQWEHSISTALRNELKTRRTHRDTSHNTKVSEACSRAATPDTNNDNTEPLREVPECRYSSVSKVYPVLRVP